MYRRPCCLGNGERGRGAGGGGGEGGGGGGGGGRMDDAEQKMEDGNS